MLVNDTKSFSCADSLQITGLFTGKFFEGDEPQVPLGLRHAKANVIALEDFPTVGEKSAIGLRVTPQRARTTR